MSYLTGVCNFCGTGCGHALQVENGAVRGVFPSSAHPVGRGPDICRTIVEKHNGRIWAEGEQGSWIAFHVALPVAGGGA